LRLAAVLLSFCLLLVGCGSGSKTLTVEGSTSVEQVLGFLTEGYEQETGNRVNFNPTGSSAGIEAVLEGRCDIGVVSRELTAEETEKLHYIPIAVDTIVLVVNPKNSIYDLNSEDIASIFKGEVTNWKHFGGEDRPIVPIGRESGSGTRDVFESATGTKGECQYVQELTSAGDIITAVSVNENAIGYTSLEAVKGSVKVLTFNGTEPTEENIKSGKYTLNRRFSLVVSASRQLPQNNREFLEFATSSRGAYYIELAGAVAVGKESQQ